MPPPLSIGEAAARYDAEQADDGIPGYGLPQHAAPTVARPEHPAGPQPTVAEMFAPAVNRTKLGAALASVLIGFVAFLASLVPVFGLVFGLVATILAIVGLATRQAKSLAITGLVLGLIAVAVSGVSTAVLVVNLVSDDLLSDDSATYGPAPEATIGAEATSGGLAITEQAFGPDALSDDVWWYVVILDNPSGVAYPAADISVQALGADGAVIDTSRTYASLPSGETALYGEYWDLSGDIVDLAVTGPTLDALGNDQQVGTVTARDVTDRNDGLSTIVTGTLVSTLDEDRDGVVVTVVARDAGGEIVDGASTYVSALLAAGTAPFEAYFYQEMPEGTQYEVYWSGF